MMSFIIGGMILLSIITGAVGGNMAAVSTAAMNGCGQAVELVISLTGTICLWSGLPSPEPHSVPGAFPG